MFRPGIVVCLLVVCSASLAFAGDVHILDNHLIRLTFEQRGEGVALASIQRVPDGSLMSLDPFSADWRVNLKTRNHPNASLALAMSAQREVPAKGMDGVMAAGADFFIANWSTQEDKAIAETPYTKGAIRLKEVNAATEEELSCTWEGDGSIYDDACRFEVTTRWTLRPGETAARTCIEVKVLPAEGESRSDIYLSSVDYPIYRIPAIGEDDHLTAPIIGGHLFHHPTKNAMSAYGNEPGVCFTSLYSYYDLKTGDCLYFHNTDTTGIYKLLEIRTIDDYVFYREHQIPPDLYESRHYVQAYEDVLGVIEGDWMDAADTYKAFLAENADWYEGPIGAETNSTPQIIKNTMVYCTEQYHGPPTQEATEEEKAVYLAKPYTRDAWTERESALGKDLHRAAQFFDSPLFSFWYAKLYEGSIYGEFTSGRRHTAYCDPLEEESELLTEAFRLANQDPDTLAAPYLNGKVVYVYHGNPDDKGPFNSRNIGAAASAIQLEGGRVMLNARESTAHACAAAPWWREHLPNVIGRHHERWGIRAAYLDYFKAFHTCYAEDHGHKPGGGDFMIQGKLYQVRRAKELVAEAGGPELALAMEGCNGPYSGEVHFGNRHIFSNWGRIPESEAIPYTEWIHDNIKYGRISGWGSQSAEETTGLFSWHIAIEVLTFGHTVSTGNGQSSYQKFYGVPSGEPYYDYTIRLANLLSGSFKKYFNGSLARVPEGGVTEEGDFHVVAEHPFVVNQPEEDVYFDSSTPGAAYAKPYILTVMPYGMFQSPDGDLAFIISNPWVGPNPFSENEIFSYNFTFDPERYREFPETYRLAYVGPDGTEQSASDLSGEALLSGTLKPGEIAYWVMER